MGGFAYQRKSVQKTCHWIKGSRHAIDGYISIKTEENQATKCRPAIQVYNHGIGENSM